MQNLITDYIVRKERGTQNENEVCENRLPLSDRSDVEIVSTSDKMAQVVSFFIYVHTYIYLYISEK